MRCVGIEYSYVSKEKLNGEIANFYCHINTETVPQYGSKEAKLWKRPWFTVRFSCKNSRTWQFALEAYLPHYILINIVWNIYPVWWIFVTLNIYLQDFLLYWSTVLWRRVASAVWKFHVLSARWGWFVGFKEWTLCPKSQSGHGNEERRQFFWNFHVLGRPKSHSDYLGGHSFLTVNYIKETRHWNEV
jgi:hypothetical protein